MRGLGALVMTALLALSGAALAGPVELKNSMTGETFQYQPSFANETATRRPSRSFQPGDRAWRRHFKEEMEMRERRRMRFQRARVRFVSGEAPGTIVVDTRARHLYFLNADGTAVRYGVGVGREGFAWSGVERVSRKADWPDWRPPAEMRQREPWLPEWMPGGPDNPLGAAALYLGSTLYRIHGTHQDETIGYAVSSGCIRMLNEDIVDLARRVEIGARVIVLGPGADRQGLMAAISPL